MPSPLFALKGLDTWWFHAPSTDHCDQRLSCLREIGRERRERQSSEIKRERERERIEPDGESIYGGMVEEIMECGREGWRTIRCSAGGGAQDKAIINRIMLRFRPIAPKPASGGEGSGGSAAESKNACVSKGRSKRKYVRVRRNSGSEYGRKKAVAPEDKRRPVTLELLPEKSDLEFSRDIGSRRSDDDDLDPTTTPATTSNPYPHPQKDKSLTRKAAVEAWVTVEFVTGTCMEGTGTTTMGFGSTEIIRNLEEDTCPGFISDGMNRVEWVNGAFRRMVMIKMTGRSGEEEGERQRGCLETKVWLVVNQTLPYGHSSSSSSSSCFSCRVKVRYGLGNDRYSQMMPCDVCRMDGGGFAWRLDVEAALTLGR